MNISPGRVSNPAGRHELVDGAVIAMSPEGAAHAEKKAAVHAALLAGIRARALACHALPDGMMVRIDDATAYEPDALVYCGTKLPALAIEVRNPLIVVEVLSRSTRHIDLSAKLADYFRVPSIAHYLIFDPEKPRLVHHARRRRHRHPRHRRRRGGARSAGYRIFDGRHLFGVRAIRVRAA
jgi:Uma2 family endonuclease